MAVLSPVHDVVVDAGFNNYSVFHYHLILFLPPFLAGSRIVGLQKHNFNYNV